MDFKIILTLVILVLCNKLCKVKANPKSVTSDVISDENNINNCNENDLNCGDLQFEGNKSSSSV